MQTEKNLKNSQKKQSSQKKEQNRFVKFIITDWPAKIVCLMLAVLLYLICRVTMLEKRSFAVPLEVTNVGNLTYSSPIPRSVRVTVRGDNSEIGVLSEKDFRAFIDTGFYTEEGLYKVPIHLELSDEATMIVPLEVQVSPEYLTIDFERKISDLKQIKVNTSGSCAKGYEVTSISIEPDVVQISGNSRQVNGMSYLETNVINLQEKTESFSQKVKILNQNPLLSITGNTDFTVKVEISPIATEKVFEGTDVYYLGLTSALAVENEKMHYKLLLGGNQNELENYKVPPRAVYVDCSDIFEPGEYELPLSVLLLPDFALKKIEPAKIKFTVISADSLNEQSDDEVQNEPPLDADETNLTENSDGVIEKAEQSFLKKVKRGQ